MPVHSPSALERLIHHDRLVIGLALTGLTALAWMYLVRMDAGVHAATLEADMHAAMGMPSLQGWGVTEWSALFAMWAIMMVAMMLPSAAPVILLLVGTYRPRAGPRPRVFLACWGLYILGSAT